MAVPEVIQVDYEGRQAALCDSVGAHLAPHIAALARDHPTRRFVTMLCIAAVEIIDGTRPGPYDAEAARRSARSALLPLHQLEEVAHLDDEAIADLHRLPASEVAIRRAEAGPSARLAAPPA